MVELAKEGNVSPRTSNNCTKEADALGQHFDSHLMPDSAVEAGERGDTGVGEEIELHSYDSSRK